MIEKFLNRIEVSPAGCWVWQGPRRGGRYDERPYGSFGKGYAHRWSYQYFNGPIPQGLEIDHLCRVRLCVNPEHLEAVTRLVNTMRGTLSAVQKARHARITHCPQGHPYDESNTYVRHDRPAGGRLCKTCGVNRTRERRRLAAR